MIRYQLNCMFNPTTTTTKWAIRQKKFLQPFKFAMIFCAVGIRLEIGWIFLLSFIHRFKWYAFGKWILDICHHHPEWRFLTNSNKCLNFNSTPNQTVEHIKYSTFFYLRQFSFSWTAECEREREKSEQASKRKPSNKTWKKLSIWSLCCLNTLHTHMYITNKLIPHNPKYTHTQPTVCDMRNLIYFRYILFPPA